MIGLLGVKLTGITNAHNLCACTSFGITAMLAIYDLDAPKKPTNLSVNSDLLKKAKELDINLSAALEQTLAEQVRTKQRAGWLKENQAAITAYNAMVEAHGSFSDNTRSF
ncbi:MAG: type II toxin-antitoxin system CcdA family antitoxin [Pseudomonadales bacterium]